MPRVAGDPWQCAQLVHGDGAESVEDRGAGGVVQAAALRLHAEDGALPVVRIGEAEVGGVAHPGRAERPHLRRSAPHRLARPLHALRDAAHQPEAPLGVQARGVAGAVPDPRAVADLVLPVGGGVVQIAGEDVVARDGDLPRLPRRGVPLRPAARSQLDGTVVRAEDAQGVILGYTCANDVTARDLRAPNGPWTRGKGYDTFCPLGPWIETELDPSDITVTTTVDGEVRQDGHVSEMIFTISELIEYASEIMTLLPGDVLLTGTPEGVGQLAAGNTVTVAVSGVGELTNPVAAG